MNRSLVSALIVAAAAGSAVAQTDVLYLNDGDGRRIFAVQGGSVIGTWAYGGLNGNERTFPIAVYDDVRTTGYSSTETGVQFDFNGNDLGGRYDHGLNETQSDGTSDGQFNYGIGWGTGRVYQYDRNWQGGQLLFTFSQQSGGITYDPTTDTFWGTGDRRTGIEQKDRNGQTISSFATNINHDWILAYEPSTDSLWTIRDGSTDLYQYAKDGTLIQTFTVNGLPQPVSFYTGEFNIPAPGAAALLGLGGLVAARRRRA